MKSLALNFVITFAVTALALTPSLSEASKDRGGGDICEDRILGIADDIATWIKSAGSKDLKLPLGISVDLYDVAMKSAVEKARVRCVKQGDQEFPVRIGSTPKVCVFERAGSEMQITCDYQTFMKSMSETEQYVLIHHEYAGLAGLESPNDEISQYSVSNQISTFLENVTVKKLAVKKVRPTPGPDTTKCNIQTMLPVIEAGLNEYLIERARFLPSAIKVEPGSVVVNYEGLLDFKDYDWVGTKQEHAFTVTFRTLKGTPIQLISSTSNWPMATDAPLNNVFSLPDVKTEIVVDREGNETGKRCVAPTSNGYNRVINFVNIETSRLVEDELISSRRSSLGFIDLN
ncbi:MAG: hypothetical protein EOP05_06520 [Proteobacteria bacterium]|nr:MAG: hypothetical protein EOP05_06520 [Pseudomonadota bacterium]